MGVYVNLHAGDSEGVFCAAVARDARSYKDEVFVEAAHVLRSVGTADESRVQKFEGLTEAVRQRPTFPLQQSELGTHPGLVRTSGR